MPLADDDGRAPAAREPPHNTEAEQALLGACLVNNATIDRCGALLPEHFYNPAHEVIWSAILRLRERGMIADPLTLKNALESERRLDGIGGPGYVARLAASVVNIVNAADYADVIRETWVRRQLIEQATDLLNDAYDQAPELSAEALCTRTEEGLFLLRARGRSDAAEPVTIGAAAERAVRGTEAAMKGEGGPRIKTGMIDVDRKLGGLLPGDYVIVGARPSMGKTSLVRSWAENIAASSDAVPVAIFSLETTAEALAMQTLAARTGIVTQRQRSGDVGFLEVGSLSSAVTEMASLGIYIDDQSGLSVFELVRRLRRMVRKFGIKVCMVDYMQLLNAHRPGNRDDGNRNVEITVISRELRAAAKDLGIVVIVLSQLSRQLETRDDKRPQLSDLRDSGSIEQDAEVVMFVFREEYYLEREQPKQTKGETVETYNKRQVAWQEQLDRAKGIAELIIAKQKGGPVGTVRVAFDGPRQRFENLWKGEAPP